MKFMFQVLNQENCIVSSQNAMCMENPLEQT